MFPVNLDHVGPFMRFVLNTHMCIHIYLIVLLHMVFQHSTYVFQHHLLKHIYLQQFSKKTRISKHWFLKHANLPRKKKNAPGRSSMGKGMPFRIWTSSVDQNVDPIYESLRFRYVSFLGGCPKKLKNKPIYFVHDMILYDIMLYYIILC